MAEIPVQPKRGVPAWVWVVVLLVIAAILWFLFGRGGSPAPGTTGRATPSEAAPVAALQVAIGPMTTALPAT